ncbi:DNA-binding beta-propeller fold protein YncE [Microbacterium sp. W4I4]|uniref:YncE family protein n=1 Tax=Microbacterium sp. W4I4 TaxID=3042295 RepID=UPI002784BBFA|nr:YncE family protein [Microbacterium sp. W4I4]MDQ0613578.1 DNA-binding beta-propeller fold protein YncE [Microbacterium sp. W4I4]
MSLPIRLADKDTQNMARSIPGTGNGNVFVVTESSADRIAFVDLSNTRTPVQTETIVGAAPWAIAVHESTRRAYVTTAEGLAVVDLDSRERIALASYIDQPTDIAYGEYRPGGTGVVVTPDGATVYAGVHRDGRNSTVERFDAASASFTDSFEVGDRPFDVQISPSGHELYTIDHDSFTVHTISVGDHTVVRTEVAPFGTELGLLSHYKPHYAAVAEDGTLYLPFQGQGLVVYSPESHEYATEPMTADSHQHGVGLTADGRLLVVGVGPIGGATLGPSLTIRDLATGSETVLPLEKGHENATEWLDAPDGRPKAVLTGGSTSRGPWDGIAVVDLESHVLTEIPVPNMPQMGVFITD